ncbi:MAG: 4-hydroxyphenylpyruvate dioxygenase [Armatimonadetes bacterium]|nr:4-hydroxyphenylpyruvate dioxygenase [Armatimonadota bacterium]
METAEQLREADQGQDLFKIHGTHHIEFYVGNAKQAAYFYRRAMGFALTGYCGPETGVRDRASYLLEQGKVRLVLTTPMNPENPIADHIYKHGDGVRDIAIHVEDAEEAYRIATERGARGVMEPMEISDANGTVKIATVATYGDTVHSFVERRNYNGAFLPNFVPRQDSLAAPVGLKHVDHVVGNVDWNKMEETVNFYKDVFGFSRFVSFDDKDISTQYSALRSTVVANENKWIKFPINEPAEGLKQSQIEEYVKFYRGAGVQHIAIECEDILHSIATMRENGVDFMVVPGSYYDDLQARVGDIQESIEDLRKLNILVDSDDKGYMLQIFTRPLEDRPTLFFEFIQRRGGESFGKGNFKALFEAIERDQAERGNL